MGCNSSKPCDPKPAAKDPKAQPTEPNAEPKGTPFVTKKKQHTDHCIMMCPYFMVKPNEFGVWKAKADAFYKAAEETDDLLFYGMGFNDGGVHIRQGYRNASALIDHLQRADKPMTDALKNCKLAKVDVYGPKSQLNKVKKVMTKIGDCYFSFYECSSTMKPCRRPTEYTGQLGSDTLVSCSITIKATMVEYKALAPKIKCVHSRARDHPGNESCLVAYCVKQCTVMLLGFFDNMESTMEHVACSVSHLGHECIHNLEMHGPDAEMAKCKALINKGLAGAENAISMVKASLESCCTRAKEEAKRAKACTAAATKAISCGVSAKMKECRHNVCSAINDLQARAEEMAKECYNEMVNVEGCTNEVARAISKGAYKKAMKAVCEVRQAADEASKVAYRTACAAGHTVEIAIEKAHAAAECGAKACHDALVEEEAAVRIACTSAEEYVKACALEAKEEAEKAVQECKAELHACRLAVECSCKAVEHACSDAAKGLRKEVCCMWTSVKKMSEEVVGECYKEEHKGAKITNEAVDLVCQRAMGACWSIVGSAEQVFYVAYEHAVSCKKSVEHATNAAVSAAESAAHRACNLWKTNEKTTGDACTEAEAMVAQNEKSVEKVWRKTTTYVVQTETR